MIMTDNDDNYIVSNLLKFICFLTIINQIILCNLQDIIDMVDKIDYKTDKIC